MFTLFFNLFAVVYNVSWQLAKPVSPEGFAVVENNKVEIQITYQKCPSNSNNLLRGYTYSTSSCALRTSQQSLFLEINDSTPSLLNLTLNTTGLIAWPSHSYNPPSNSLELKIQKNLTTTLLFTENNVDNICSLQNGKMTILVKFSDNLNTTTPFPIGSNPSTHLICNNCNIVQSTPVENTSKEFYLEVEPQNIALNSPLSLQYSDTIYSNINDQIFPTSPTISCQIPTPVSNNLITSMEPNFSSMLNSNFSNLPLTVENFPSSFDLSEYSTVMNQGSQNSCVAFIFAEAMTIFLSKNRDITPMQARRAPAFIYNLNCQANSQCSDTITFAEAIATLTNSGVPHENFMPYNDSDCTSIPDATTLDEASKFKILSALKIDRNINAIKGALFTGHPILTSVRLGNNFGAINQNNPIWLPNNTPSTSGHALLIVGYNDNYLYNGSSYGVFKVQNSWGSSFGNNGYFYIKYADLMKNSIHPAQYLTFLVPSFQDDQVNLADNLVVRYPFNGTTSSSGNSNFNGIASGVTYDVGINGISNNSAKFNGVNSFITLPSNLAFNNANDFSITFWIKPGSTFGTKQAIISQIYENFGIKNLEIGLENNKIYTKIPDKSENNTFIFESNLSQVEVIPNQWNHVSITWSGQVLRTYINSELAQYQPWVTTWSDYTPFTTSAEAKNIILGATGADSSGEKSNFYTGLLDNLYIHSRALNNKEILKAYEDQL